MSRTTHDNVWPPLPLDEWIETRDTLHMWLQIIGKIRLARTPPINHSWHTTLYLTARGLTTTPIAHDGTLFQIDCDLLAHRLVVAVSDGRMGGFDLAPMTVAAFYHRVGAELQRLELPVRIVASPNEVSDALPFASDERHRSYDAGAVTRFWRALLQADRVMKIFRARFTGKCSPVHFFWGAMDHAVTRFSGRPAPQHPGGIPNLPDRITREAYSHEVSSCGFWPGSGPIAYPAFYAYAYPQPPGFAAAKVRPAQAFYSEDFGEFVLPYEVVRQSDNPDDVLLQFFQSTYEAAADLAGWDRAALEW